jgi:hypothetical protein
MAFGRPRDIVLITELRSRCGTLDQWLKSVGTTWRDGLIFGHPAERRYSAENMRGLELLETDDLEHFRIPSKLPKFQEPRVQRPRERDTYNAPILLIKEFYKSGPRPVTAVADRDLVFTDAYFGASLNARHLDAAQLISTILSSSLSSWFFLMTASEFGVWKRRLHTRDVRLLPLPDISQSLSSDSGRALIALHKKLRVENASPAVWQELDGLSRTFTRWIASIV